MYERTKEKEKEERSAKKKKKIEGRKKENLSKSSLLFFLSFSSFYLLISVVQIFGGFATELWKISPQKFYGTGESFLFTLRPTMQVRHICIEKEAREGRDGKGKCKEGRQGKGSEGKESEAKGREREREREKEEKGREGTEGKKRKGN